MERGIATAVALEILLILLGIVGSLVISVSIIKKLRSLKSLPAQDPILYKIFLVIAICNSFGGCCALFFRMFIVHSGGQNSIKHFVANKSGPLFYTVSFMRIMILATLICHAAAALQLFFVLRNPNPTRLVINWLLYVLMASLLIRGCIVPVFYADDVETQLKIFKFFGGPLILLFGAVISAFLVYLQYLQYQQRLNSLQQELSHRLGLHFLGVLICLTPCALINATGTQMNASNLIHVIADVSWYSYYFCMCLAYMHMATSSDGQHDLCIPIFTVAEEIRYHDSHIIGHSNTGTVYKGNYREATVAIKHLHVQSPDMLSATQHENVLLQAIFLCKIVHPNLACILGAYVTHNNFYIVSEYCHYGSLRDVLDSLELQRPEDLKLDWKIRLSLALDIAVGIRFLHQCEGSIPAHCHLKSTNVLLSESLTAKVADFGTILLLSSFYELTRPQTHQQLIAATIASRWAAPEILNSSAVVDNKALDVYSIGLILWELLTFEVPFGKTDPMMQVQKNIIKGFRPQIPSQCAAPIKYLNLLQCCWAQDPELRPNIDHVLEKLGETLQEVMQGEGSMSLAERRGEAFPIPAQSYVVL